MSQGYLVSEDFVRQSRWMYRRLHGDPINRPQKRAKYPILPRAPGVKFYILTEDTYLYRGSHRDYVAASEVQFDTTNLNRATFKVVREDVQLYCGHNGVYVQRDTGLVGNDPGDPDGGGDPDVPPPCPPNCVFTGNGSVSADVASTAPDWWFLGGNQPTANISATAAANSTTPTLFAVTGMKRNGIDFTFGQWESRWIGVIQGDVTAGTADVEIDGIGQVAAAVICSDPLSDGTTVDVMFRDLGGAGGFAVVQAICCPGYDA